ncbi:MAG: Ig-like domain-containing protein, partial [Thermoplasmata archaeon]|nr:Ig-like domain-containing protein [Thermoplasmata archaeon]
HPTIDFIDSNLTDGVRYYYKLQAWDAIGSSSGFSDVVSNIPIDEVAPAVPRNFTATAISIDTINLSWSPCSDPDLVGYEIYRSTAYDGSYKKINPNLVNSTTFQDLGRGSNTTYFYKIKAYDEVPNYSNFSVIISNTTLPILDLTHPTIFSFTPNGTNVYPYIKVKVTFSELMNQTSVKASFKITPAIPGEYSWSLNKRTFIFDPDKKLIEGQTYNVSIGLNATDLAGNSIEKLLTWEFTIGDYTAPLLISSSPNGTEVPITTPIEVVFNEELDKSYITSSAILLKHSNGTFVIGKITYYNKSIIFKPNNDLENGINYTVMVNRLLRDLNGNIFDQDFTWNFITELAEPEPSPEEEPKGFDTTMVGILILIFILIIFVAGYIMLKRLGLFSKKSIAKSKAPLKKPKKIAAGEADLQCQWCGAGVSLENAVCPECGEILDGEELEE